MVGILYFVQGIAVEGTYKDTKYAAFLAESK